MILKGNQRGGAKDLALHLLKEENDHIEVHELRGFASDDLMGALNEAYAVSRGTRCKQFLYSLSLNPPKHAQVATESFESAIEKAEERLGLSGQPRAIVFHEKEGRRHAHAVWSRIDTDKMKAVHMFRDHTKLTALSRELYLEHGWTMPRGLANSEERDPKNFTLEQWQRAKRTGQEPHAAKTAIQDSWAISDSKAAFTHAMEERGFKIAQGDRRGFVAVDHHGEVYSIPRCAGVKTKEVRQRLGEQSALPGIAETKERIAQDMLSAMGRLKGELDTQAQEQAKETERRRLALIEQQRSERQALHEKIEQRRAEENRLRQQRFRKGVKGLWDRLRGEHNRVQQQNQREAEAALIRDRQEKDVLVFGQLEQRRAIRQRDVLSVRQHKDQRRKIQNDTLRYNGMHKEALAEKREEFLRKRNSTPKMKHSQTRGLDIGS